MSLVLTQFLFVLLPHKCPMCEQSKLVLSCPFVVKFGLAYNRQYNGQNTIVLGVRTCMIFGISYCISIISRATPNLIIC